jgi:hypothetical protein
VAVIEKTVTMVVVAEHERLFEVGPAVEAPVKQPRVDKTFRAYDPASGVLLPPSLDDWLPEDHLAWFVSEQVLTDAGRSPCATLVARDGEDIGRVPARCRGPAEPRCTGLLFELAFQMKEVTSETRGGRVPVVSREASAVASRPRTGSLSADRR